MRKRLLLILLCCLAALLLAVGSAVWWTSRYMRTPEFRNELALLVKEATGREVSLEGELTVSFFPWFGLKAQGLTLGNDPRFGLTPLLTARQISARIRVMPLFRRRLVFDTVELDNADLILTLDTEGRGNWDGLAERLRAQENSTERADAFFHKITVRGIRLVDSQARLDDLEHNHSYIMTGVDLRTGRIESGKPLPFTIVSEFTWPRPGLKAHLEGAGQLHWSALDPLPLFTDTTVHGEIGGTFMPKSSPMAGVSTTVTLEDGGKHLRLSDLRLRLIGADVTGEVTFFDVTEMFRLEARLHTGRFSPRAVINAYWPGTIAHEHQGALHAAGGALNIFATVDELVFESPGFVLDASHLKGKVRMGFDEVSGLEFGVSANHLDADALGAAFTSNATSTPVVVGDLPLDYLREVKGEGSITAETLKLAGVTGQGAQVLWQGGQGQHRVQLKPLKAQGGSITAELSASFAGGEKDPRATSGMASPAIVGWGGSLRMDDVDARQVSWLNKPGLSTSGKMNLRARADAQKATLAPTVKLAQVARRATIEAQAALGPSTLDWAADKSQPKAVPRRMGFSSIQAQARFVPAAAGDVDWALQMDGGLSAVGTKPLLNLDARIGGLLRSQQGKVLLSGASASGRLKGWFLPKRENEASFSGKGVLDVAAQSLNLAAASVQACGLSLSGPISGSKVLGGDWTLAGRIRCQDGDPKRVLGALDLNVPKSSDKRVLQRLSGEADLTLSAKGASLANISAQFDDLPVRGSYSVQNFDSPKQTLSLSGGVLDLDRYLPAPEPPRRGAPPEKPTPEPLPVETLRDLNLEGTVALRSFKYRGVTTRDFKATAHAGGGSLLVKPMGGNFYGGVLTGEFSAQVAPGGMQTRLSIAAKDFQAGPFMIGWAGKEFVTGRTDMFLDLGGVGATDVDVMRSLEGMAGFKITDGSYVLSGAGETQPAPKRPPGATAQPTAVRRPGAPFSKASARLKVNQGVFQSDDFRMDGANMVVTGKGRFSPVDDSINLTLSASMTGIPDVPIKVFGRLKDPEMEVPTGALIGNAIKEILGIPLKPIKFFKDLLF